MDKNINSALVQDGALTLFSYRIQSEKMALFFYNIFEELLGQWGGLFGKEKAISSLKVVGNQN